MRRAKRRRRTSVLAACGCGAVVLVSGHFVFALRTLQVAVAPSPPSPPPLGAVPPSRHSRSAGGVDLDARYPAEAAYWSDEGSATGSAPWLVAMRAGWLGDQPEATRSIPRRIHQTWKDAAPPKVLFSPRWRASLQSLNAGWEYRLWTDADNRALVAERYPWFLPTFDAYPSPIQRADASRYLVVRSHGGMYADLDTECFRPFGPLLERRGEAAGASLLLSYKAGANFSKGACNSIFGSSARHPFWEVVLDVMANRSRTPLRGHKDVLYSTGPAVLREAIRRLLRLPPESSVTAPMLAQLRRLLGIVVLDAKLLHPLTAERRGEARAGEGGLPAGAYCTHHFVTSWVSHSAELHADTEERRRSGDARAAMNGEGQPVLRENAWGGGGGGDGRARRQPKRKKRPGKG